jgi:hypothetical protein
MSKQPKSNGTPARSRQRYVRVRTDDPSKEDHP